MKWVWLTYPWGLINSNITSSLWSTERLHSSAKLCYFYQKSIQHLVLHLNLCPRGTTCHLILVNFKGVSRCLKLRQRFSRDEILNQEYRLDSFSISFHQFSVWDAVWVLLSCYQMFLGFFRERRAAASELK